MKRFSWLLAESRYHSLDGENMDDDGEPNDDYNHEDDVHRHVSDLLGNQDRDEYTSRHVDAIKRYTGDESSDINHSLIAAKGNRFKLSPHRQEMVEAINDAIDKTPPLFGDNHHFYSGAGIGLQRELAKAKKGSDFFSPALLSASTDHNIALDRGGGHFQENYRDHDWSWMPKDHPAFENPEPDHVSMRTVAHFHLPHGFAHGIFVGGYDYDDSGHSDQLSEHPAENEYILRNGLTFRVAKVHVHPSFPSAYGGISAAWKAPTPSLTKVVTFVPHPDHENLLLPHRPPTDMQLKLPL